MVGRWNVLLKGPLFGDMSILGKVPVKKEHFPLPWLWEIFPRWNHSNTSSNQTGILRVFWWKEWGVPEIFLEQPKKHHFIWVKASPKFFGTRFFLKSPCPPLNSPHMSWLFCSSINFGRKSRPPHRPSFWCVQPVWQSIIKLNHFPR